MLLLNKTRHIVYFNCFVSIFNKYKIVGKGWVKCARKPYRVFCLFLNLITDFQATLKLTKKSG